MTTKTAIKSAYIAALQAAYPFYEEGSRPLELAHKAADAALNGVQTIKGECWDKALEACGLSKWATLKELAALPA